MPLLMWLHGLGDTGAGWESLRYELADVKDCQFQFPTAPRRGGDLQRRSKDDELV